MDFEIVNLARNLESLELNFWNSILNNYTDSDFSSAGYDGLRNYITQFRNTEIVHFTLLNDADGGGFKNCTYDTYGTSDLTSALMLGQVFTSVGEGAFIGALALLQNGTVRQSGGEIIGNEARQNFELRQALGLEPFNAYPLDTPLTASQAYSLAYPYLSGCPSSNAPISFTLIPPLMAAFNSGDHSVGSQVNIMWDASKVYLGTDVSITFINSANFYNVPLCQTGTGMGKVELPAGLRGTAFLVATNYQGPGAIPAGQNFAIGALVVN